MIVSLMILSLVLILANMIKPSSRGAQVVSVIAVLYIMPAITALIAGALIIAPITRISKLLRKKEGSL